MFDLIYNFINDYLIGATTVITDAQKSNVAALLTVVCIVLITFVLIRLIRWCFSAPFNIIPKGKFRD